MPQGDVETFHMVGEWHNMIVGERGVFSSDPDRGTAVRAGRKLAHERHIVHTITNADGTIAGRNDYGVDAAT